MRPGDLSVLLAMWFVAWSVVSFLQFGWDKEQARAGGWRISEGMLIGVALIGGALGAKLAQRAFRHKTRKQPFAKTLNGALVFNIVGAGLILWSPSRAFLFDLIAQVAG